MKRRLLLLIVLGFVLLSSGVLYKTTWLGHVEQSSTAKQQANAQELTQGADSIMDVPIYPGATNIQKPQDPTASWANTSFETETAIKDVVAFYEDSLLKNGWADFSDRSYENDALNKERDFHWPKTTNIAPYRLFLHLEVWKSEQIDILATTRVRMATLRVPDPMCVPLHPSAEQVNIESVQEPNGTVVRTVSYVTKVGASDIRTFYHASLGQFGWKASPERTSNELEGISFDFREPGPRNSVLWGTVYIGTSQVGTGETRVELRVTGYNIQANP